MHPGRSARAAGAAAAVFVSAIAGLALMRAAPAPLRTAPGSPRAGAAGAAVGPRPATARASRATAAGDAAGPLRPALDLGAVMDQVHFAYRRAGAGWRGGHQTFSSVRGPDGVLEVTPFHHAPSPTGRAVRVVEGSPVRFGPARVVRGDALLAEGAGEARGGPRGELEISRGAVVEELRNGREGVEQSWRFEAPPAGRGDLEVRIALAAGRLVGDAGDGLHFTGGALGVRYGHGRWIDGAGIGTDVPVRWEDERLVLRVPAGVLERSAYPAVLDPLIGPEQSMGAPVYEGVAPQPQTLPAVAWSRGCDVAPASGCYLAVWRDDRTLGGAAGTGSNIVGARVTADGRLVEPNGVCISGQAGHAQTPAIASNGTDWLVVWSDARNATRDIYGARVGASGSVLDASGVPIATGSGDEDWPAVASNGTDWLVAWEDPQNAVTGVSGARVSAAGAVLDAQRLLVSGSPGDQRLPRVASVGSDYLVVWQDGGALDTGLDIHGARVSASGAVLDAIAITTAAGHQAAPSVASNGIDALVVWFDRASQKILGARVRGSDGAVRDPSPVAISDASIASVRGPVVAWNGTRYLVGWSSRNPASLDGDVFGQLVSATDAAIVPDGAPFAISALPGTRQVLPALASDGSGFLAVWADTRMGGDFEIFGARVDADGAVLDPSGLHLSAAANAQEHPAIASNGADYLVVWSDSRNPDGTSDVYGARVSGADGALLDPGGIGVCTAPGAQRAPAVASDGTDYLVVWEDARNATTTDVYGAILRGADGTVATAMDGFGISTLDSAQAAPAVAWGRTSYLVVWEDTRNLAASAGAAGTDIYGARVSATGEVLDASGRVIASSALNQASPALTWNGSSYLVAFRDDGMLAGDGVIAVARVDDSGALIGSSAMIGGYLGGERAPAVASSGDNDWVLVWDKVAPPRAVAVTHLKFIPNPSNPAVGAWYPSSSLTHQLGGASDPVYPAVAFNGTHYLAVWQDPSRGNDLYGARISLMGADANPDPFLIATAVRLAPDLTVTRLGADFLVGYTKYDEALLRVRAHVRRIPGNRAPVARGGTFTIAEDSPTLEIPLSALVDDPDLDRLTFIFRGAGGSGVPVCSHAECSFGLTSISYAPRRDANGTDQFAFTVSDGLETSAIGTVTISVTPVNDAPAVQMQQAGTPEDTPVQVHLTATDVDGDLLTYRVVTGPQHGALSGTAPDLVYTPAQDYAGDDSFTFVANDGTVDSTPATVWIWVSAVNDPPVAGDAAATTAEDTAVDVPLPITHPDVEPVTVATVTGPAHGAVTFRYSTGPSGSTAADATYSPDPNFDGTDAFSYFTSDGVASSAVATVTIRVTPVNDPPVARPQALITPEDTALAVRLEATDAEADPLSYRVLAGPTHGALSGTPPELVYTPAPNYAGADSFTYAASDGRLDSAVATVRIEVTPMNDRPVAHSSTSHVTPGNSVTLILSGSDVESATLTYAVVQPPSHGTLSGTPPVVSYTPDPGFAGTDTVTFTASDGQAESEPATISVRVGGPPATSAGDATPPMSAYGCSSGGGVAGLLPLAGLALALRRARRRRAAGTVLAVALASLALPAAGHAAAPDGPARRAKRAASRSAPGAAGLPAPTPAGRAAATPTPPPAADAPSPAPARAVVDVPLPPPPRLTSRKPQRLRVALMPMRPGVGVDAALAALVTDALVAELADRGLTAITSKDVEAALGFERQKQILGCADDGCLAQIGGALGADRVVFGDLAQLGGLTVFSAQVFDTRSGTVDRRFHERMSGADPEDLLDATERAAAELFPGTTRAATASHRRSILTSGARPLALVLRGGADVREAGGFGALMLEARLGRSLRLGAGPVGAGAKAFGAAARLAVVPFPLERLSVYAAAEAQVLFPKETLVAGLLAVGAEWAFTGRFSLAAEAPVVLMASAPARYRSTYFMPGLAMAWRF